MTKAKIAKEFAKNTQDAELKRFVLEYLAKLESLELGNSFDDEEFASFDKCVNYIKNLDLAVQGWGLFEIPIEGVFTFCNQNTCSMFDLEAIDDEIVPAFIGSDAKSHKALSVKDAIANYICC